MEADQYFHSYTNHDKHVLIFQMKVVCLNLEKRRMQEEAWEASLNAESREEEMKDETLDQWCHL